MWNAVAADWRTAPLQPELSETLGFLETMTLRPEELTPEDAQRVLDAGVSKDALRNAATICALFTMIVRLADSLGWDVPPPEQLATRAPFMLESGYALMTAPPPA